MYSQIDTSKLTRAGRFLLDDITLVSYQSADGSNKNAKSISIKTQVLEIDIYESLDGTGLSGSVVVADGQSVISHLPLTGYERIEFRLFTPGTSRGYDFSSETGHPMFIYKISNQTKLSLEVIFVKNLDVEKEIHFATKILAKHNIFVKKYWIKSDKDGNIKCYGCNGVQL